jgi:hypothetical protein
LASFKGSANLTFKATHFGVVCADLEQGHKVTSIGSTPAQGLGEKVTARMAGSIALKSWRSNPPARAGACSNVVAGQSRRDTSWAAKPVEAPKANGCLPRANDPVSSSTRKRSVENRRMSITNRCAIDEGEGRSSRAGNPGKRPLEEKACGLLVDPLRDVSATLRRGEGVLGSSTPRPLTHRKVGGP